MVAPPIDGSLTLIKAFLLVRKVFSWSDSASTFTLVCVGLTSSAFDHVENNAWPP